MRRDLAVRNVVLPEADSPGFDVAAFAAELDLGAGENVIRVDNISVTEWDKARLQVLPDRLQLGFKPAADGEFIRRVVEAFLARRDGATGREIGFNSVLLLTLEEGDPDPSEKVLSASRLTEALGGSDGRGGVTLVYKDDLSRWWMELSPQPEQDRVWTFDFNRHFASFPGPGDDRNAVLDWFADVGANIIGQFETIVGGATDARRT